jgi:hypothetical protein
MTGVNSGTAIDTYLRKAVFLAGYVQARAKKHRGTHGLVGGRRP